MTRLLLILSLLITLVGCASPRYAKQAAGPVGTLEYRKIDAYQETNKREDLHIRGFWIVE